MIDTPDPAVAGGLLDYDITVLNSGDTMSPAATLTFPLDANYEFVSVTSAASCSYVAAAPRRVECDLGPLQGTLSGGAPIDVKITVRALIAGPTSVNVAATVTPSDGNPINNTLTQNTTINAGADLTIQAMAFAPDPAVAGGIVTLSTLVQNFGPNAAAGATLTFNLPPGLGYRSGSHGGAGWSCAAAGQAVTCSTSAMIASLGVAATLTWDATVTHGQVGTIQTQASVSSSTGDGNGSNNSAAADLSVTAGTDLEVVKTVSPNPVLANDAVDFTVQVNNIGPFEASAIEVTDTVPANFAAVSASGTGWNCSVSGSDVTCTRPLLAVGSAPSITISATAPDNPQILPATGMSVTNTASVSTATQDPISSNDSGSVTFDLLRTSADLRMIFSRSSLPVSVGQTLTSTIRVRNLGPLAIAAASAFQASYEASANESYVSFSGAGWSYLGLFSGRHLFEHAGPLAVNSNAANLVITTRATIAGTIQSTACTGSTNVTPPQESDINPANDCRSRSNTGSALSADISLTKSVAPGTLVNTDGSITYTLTITNNTANPALNVRLTDPIPMYSGAHTGGGETRPATTVVGNWVNGGTSGGCTDSDGRSAFNTQSCSVGTVTQGTPAVVTITVSRPMKSGNWTNNAAAYSYGTGDTNLANNRASASVAIDAQVDLTVTQKSVTPNPVLAGVEALYTIQVRNLGPSTAQNVVLTDTFTTMPGDFTFISASATDGGTCGAYDGINQRVACSWGSIGSTGVRTMTVRIRPNHLGVQHAIANTAVATTDTYESDTLAGFPNNTISQTLNVTPAEIDLLIEETDLADPIGYDPGNPGSNLIVYKVDITNGGPSFATGVAFTDTVTGGPGGRTISLLCDRTDAPSGAATTCAGAPAPICAVAGSVATCTFADGDMAATTSRTHYLIYQINDEPATSGDTFSKTAAVTANEPETLAGNNSEDETTTTRVLADVEVTSKTATPATVSINQPFDWTILVTNNGPGTAKVVSLTDNMPSNMVLTALPTSDVGTCAGALGSGNVTCDIGDLMSGAVATITLPVRITAFPMGGTSTNTASVTTESLDIVSANNSNTGTVAVTRSSVDCEVYIDANDDGQRGGTEAGINGVEMTLSGTDAYGNPVNMTTMTMPITKNVTGMGHCQFLNLPPSDPAGYTLAQTHPAAFIDGQDYDGTTVIVDSKATDVITGIIVPADTALSGYQFGELQYASLAGRVWYDPSNDGVIDAAEAVRISGVTIALAGTDDLGQAVNSSTTTAGDGSYSFTSLRPGTYTVTETEPANYLPGLAAVGSGAMAAAGMADNNPAAPTFGNVIAGIGLASGNTGTQYNFGELRPGSLAGTVYYDIDNSGAQDPGEPAIENTSVTLTGTDYRGNGVTALPTTTDPNGNYAFADLLPGTYIITETQPTGYSDGLEALGTLGGNVGADVFTAVVLASEQAGLGYDFGERSAGLAGVVYEDIDNDGIQGPGEAGIQGVTIDLTGCATRTIQTDANGAYQIVGLPACQAGYTLTQTQPAGFSDGKDSAGTFGGDATTVNDVISAIILGPADYSSANNFGEHAIAPSDVACTTPAPGAKNIREPFDWTFTVSNNGPNGAPVTNLADTLPAGLELTAAPATTQGSCTGASGDTGFSCALGYLTNGQTITVTAPVRALSYPAGGTMINSASVTTDGNDAVAGNNSCEASVTIQQATLAGAVYEDPNNNGIKEGFEAPIPGAQLALTGTDLYGNAVSESTATQPDGNYAFNGLAPAGTDGYTVTQAQPAPFLPGLATPGTGTTTAGVADNALLSPAFGNVISGIGLATGEDGIAYNFGELNRASLAGTVYFDIDNSSQQNGSEPGIPNTDVTLTGTDYRGRAVTPTTIQTSGDGSYSFANLLPGTYAITEAQPATYSDGQEDLGSIGGTPGADSFTDIALGSGIDGIGYDFGELRAGLAGTVYDDLNNDGVQDPGEAGIPSATITLSGCTNRTAQTDASGNYQIGNIPACPTGYTLSETQPAGYSDGQETAGSHGGDAASVNDAISAIVLTLTDYATGYNFGEHGIVATDVSCTATSPGTKNIREPFNWTFLVGNGGPGAAPATNFADTLPAGLELTAAPTTTQGTCTGASGDVSFGCDIGFLATGQSVTVTAPLRAISFPAGGTLTNISSVTTEGADTNAGNDNCQADITIQESTLTGKVFDDPNDNGVQETGEAAIANVELTLTGTDIYGNALSQTATTIADGSYSFTGLAPSDPAGYTLAETQPANFADGKDTLGDSGGTLANDLVSAIPIAANINAAGYDFAEISQGLAGTVYVDSNDNGSQDAGEPGIANVTITVTGTADDGSSVNLSVQTIADGSYFFGGLPPSNPAGYVLSETQPAAWADGRDALGIAGGTLGNDQVTALVLPAGQISTDYDFGERGASICGYVYSDLSNDGIKDAGEIGIPAAELALAGTDIDGNPIADAVTTTDLSATAGDLGRYCFADLPLPDATGYTITETQPVDTSDGVDTVGDQGGTAGNDVISQISFTTPGITAEGYNFGETLANPASLSGFVWLDSDHQRDRDEPTGRGGWTVELYRGDVGGDYTVLGSTQTADDGSYVFTQLPPGPGYGLIFREPNGGYAYGFIDGVTLTANTTLDEQNQPIDPEGVVYDALTRQPVAGALVTISGPPGFDPSANLLGNPADGSQTTGPTGEYNFLLLGSAPSGIYTISVTNPAGYIPGPSTAIPACTNTLVVGATPVPALVQLSDAAPVSAAPVHNPNTCAADTSAIAAGAGSTQYYLTFDISTDPFNTSANVLNNHIPIEAVPTGGALTVSKTTPKTDVSRGELVPYTISVRNNIDLLHTAIALVDQIPPGFKYRVGTAQIDGLRTEPQIIGRTLTWSGLSVARGQTRTIKLMLVVGSGVGEARYVNQAWALNTITGGVVSNIATATVRVVPDATFDCSDIIGKVFDDRNRNGYPDRGERGLANVRIATVRGLLVKTDKYGRFHVACADIPDEDRGSNFIMKLDTRTLPTGYRMTTENPRVIRITRGKMAKFNFGAAIHRVVRIDVAGSAFEAGSSDLRPRWVRAMNKAIAVLSRDKSVLRIGYARAAAENRTLARNRMRALVGYIRRGWRQSGGGYDLAIETEFYVRRRLK